MHDSLTQSQSRRKPSSFVAQNLQDTTEDPAVTAALTLMLQALRTPAVNRQVSESNKSTAQTVQTQLSMYHDLHLRASAAAFHRLVVTGIANITLYVCLTLACICDSMPGVHLLALQAYLQA